MLHMMTVKDFRGTEYVSHMMTEAKMMDTTHLNALRNRLSNERVRLANAKTESERALRRVWISQIEKEIGEEKVFIGDDADMTDEELLTALMA